MTIIRFFLALLLIGALAIPAQAAGEKVLDVQLLRSKSGIEGWFVEDRTVPVIAMSFSFEGGLAHDPDGKPGVGRLVSILLDEGAGDLKSQEFQQKLSDNAISLSFSAGRDAFYGQVKTLSVNKDLAFDLLRMALTQPRFDADAITRMKNANISKIKSDMGEPAWLTARTFNGMVFEGHNYALPGFGTLESMQIIKRDDLITFTKEQFTRPVLKVAIAGDISKDDATALLDKIFASLPEKSPATEKNDAKINYGGKTILLPLDTPQTYITVGGESIRHDDKDWHAALVMNYILGGGSFDSRLMHEIREKRGLTYGVYSTLNDMRHAGIIQATMSTSNEKAEEALRLLKDEWRSMAKDGPTHQELQDAKSYLTGSLPLELTSTSDISGTLNSLQRDGYDADYINQRNNRLNAVTIDDVKRAAARILKTESLVTVLVGQPKNINIDILLDKAPGTTPDSDEKK